VVIEGPFARNPVYVGALATLCAPQQVQVSIDVLEGTARGAWMLTHWTEPGITSAATYSAEAVCTEALTDLHRRWLDRVAAAGSTAAHTA
jgi:L-fuculokinase